MSSVVTPAARSARKQAGERVIHLDFEPPLASLLDRYIQYVRNVMIGLAVLGVLAAIVFVFSVIENEGCLPWQTPVGVDSSPFAGNQDTAACR